VGLLYKIKKGKMCVIKWGRFEKYVTDLMEKEKMPGVAIAISQNGQVIYERGFGVIDIETKEPVTPETIFGTASITKSFIALAIMKLAEEGKLQVDDAVKMHLPKLNLEYYYNINDIKIHHLLSHTTGIETIKRDEALASFDEHLDYLSGIELETLGRPGRYFCYNNDMFLLLGAIVEKVTGENYQDYIQKEIFRPMNMTRTTFNLEELAQFSNVTTPYIIEDSKPTSCSWPILGNYAVGGGIRSTVMDLLKYGNLYIDKENTFTRKMTKAVHKTNGTSSYGYGFQTTPNYNLKGLTLVEHGGSQPGVSSNFGFVREQEIVAAVLTNLSGVSADAIWLGAINTVLGLPADRKRSIEPHFQLVQGQHLKFIGNYQTGEGSTVTISYVNEKLMATVDGKMHSLRASNPETLVITPIERPIRFFFNEYNETWALFLGLRMFVKSD